MKFEGAPLNGTLDTREGSERVCPTTAKEPSHAAVEHLCREWAEVARAILMRRQVSK